MQPEVLRSNSAPNGRAPHPYARGVITAEVVREHQPALLAVARRMLRRAEDAEDVVQETWFSALRSEPQFESRSSLRTWLISILRRRCFDRYQADRRTPLPLEEIPEQPVWEGARMELREAATYAAQALSTLQEQERTAVKLCDLDDRDRDEAASFMHVTRGHLRVILHRARQKLERQLVTNGVNAEILA